MTGEALALGSALAWSVAIILFRRSEAVSPLALNLFKNVAATLLLAATFLLMGGTFSERSWSDWLRLIVSGVLGITFADVLFFHALRRLGPARLAVVECAYAPFIVALSVLFLDESMTPAFVVGASLVVGGMLTVALPSRRHRAVEPEGQRAKALVGVLCGAVAMAAMGGAVVLAKPAFANGSVIEVTLIRLIAGSLALLLFVLPVAERRAELNVFRPQRVWFTLAPAAFIGSYLSSLLWIGGFKYAEASVAAVLNQTTTVFTLILARLFLAEAFTRRSLLAVALGIIGTLLVALDPSR